LTSYKEKNQSCIVGIIIVTPDEKSQEYLILENS